jgi:hypothetical protein
VVEASVVASAVAVIAITFVTLNAVKGLEVIVRTVSVVVVRP